PPDLGMLPEPERPAVLRALAKEAKDRWPTCRAFVEALRSSPDAGELRRDYDEAIRLAPGDAQAHYHRGLAYYRSGDDDRAIADFDAAIRLDPGSSAAYDGRGNAHDRQGDPARAKADHEQAARLRSPPGA